MECPPTAHSDTQALDTRDVPWHACTRPQCSPMSGNRSGFSRETEPLTDAHTPSPGQSSFNKINPLPLFSLLVVKYIYDPQKYFPCTLPFLTVMGVKVVVGSWGRENGDDSQNESQSSFALPEGWCSQVQGLPQPLAWKGLSCLLPAFTSGAAEP